MTVEEISSVDDKCYKVIFPEPSIQQASIQHKSSFEYRYEGTKQAGKPQFR